MMEVNMDSMFWYYLVRTVGVIVRMLGFFWDLEGMKANSSRNFFIRYRGMC